MSRFECTLNRQCLRLAQRDLHLAREEQDHLPALSAGLLEVQRGRLCAYMAGEQASLYLGPPFHHEGVKPDRCGRC